VSLHITARARYEFLNHLISERLRPPAAIAELGAAPEDQICAIAKAGFTATAVDIGIDSDGRADNTEGRMQRLQAHRVTFVEWDLEQVQYPLEDEAFDAWSSPRSSSICGTTRSCRCRSVHEFSGRVDTSSSPPKAGYVMNRFAAAAGTVRLHTHTGLGGSGPASTTRTGYLFSEVDQAMNTSGPEVVLHSSRFLHVADSKKCAQASEGSLHVRNAVRR
jgi:hypothetical protein